MGGDEALRALRRADPVLARLIKQHGPPPVGRPTPGPKRFAELAEAILYQQLAGRAAATIHGRFVVACGGAVTPEAVAGAGYDSLRSCGLSNNKALSILDLAEKTASGQLSLGQLGRMSDDGVVAHLTQVRGIGPWTAHMFLMFGLGRPDIWPCGDYGVRAGFASAWALPEMPTEKALMPLGEPFRPWRSTVAWYCWRAVEAKVPEQ